MIDCRHSLKRRRFNEICMQCRNGAIPAQRVVKMSQYYKPNYFAFLECLNFSGGDSKYKWY